MKLQLIYSFKIQIKYQFCKRFIPNQNDVNNAMAQNSTLLIQRGISGTKWSDTIPTTWFKTHQVTPTHPLPLVY